MSDTKAPADPAPSRIQRRNRKRILEAALDVFSQHGYRGATLDQIAEQAGLSKPNLLYYFAGKEEIHVTLLHTLMDRWLDPLRRLDPHGAPLDEILTYVRRKLEMSEAFPRESRLFANEILQGAPRIAPLLEGDLKPLFDDAVALIEGWMDAGAIAVSDARHLIFSIWATTQHYADFEAQISVLMPGAPAREGAGPYLVELYRKALTPGEG
ncbi:TetR family transcriptional regulator C-terminal domain-containing protein [Roseovarius sp. Pro17]|uniref:TetR family transcriptional regulator C-terminal domain-containing protein n=1 Tax=Roseovarius sp. Pro17 TaxID=3108175 RepID=UPI002D7944B4|nr:TetR family transcriptional regulator C-terminal domain-containing protein [Roseovarius sp. Pro17]